MYIWDLFVSDAAGNNLSQITNSGSSYGEYDEPQWSPDGTKIVCQHGRNIVVINEDGTGEVSLTSETSNSSDHFPSWSADGSKIVFERDVDDMLADYRIVTMNNNGSNAVEVFANTVTTRFAGPHLSPDGAKIIFDMGNKIYTINSDGSNRTYLSDGFAPSYSPDGSKILYLKAPVYNIDIFTMNNDGTNSVDVAVGSTGTGFYDPAWSPDGKYIITTLTGNNYQIYILDANGSNWRLITKTDNTYENRYPSWKY
jgi:Tol biopolymer transport system component